MKIRFYLIVFLIFLGVSGSNCRGNDTNFLTFLFNILTQQPEEGELRKKLLEFSGA